MDSFEIYCKERVICFHGLPRLIAVWKGMRGSALQPIPLFGRLQQRLCGLMDWYREPLLAAWQVMRGSGLLQNAPTVALLVCGK